MLMDLPTILQLTTLILQPTRASAFPFTPYSGFIAGHICAPAGGGEDGVVPSCGASSTAAPPGSEPLPPTLRWPSGAAFGPPLGNLICELGDVGFDDLHSPRLRALFGFPHRGINVAQSRNLLAGDATGRCLYEIVNDA